MRTIVLGMKQPASPPITFSLVGVHSFQVDIMFGLKPNEEESRSHSGYAEKWRKRMAEAYQPTSKEDQKGQARAKNDYDKKTYGGELQQGCRLLVRNLTERGAPGKLWSYWEEKVHVVLDKKQGKT